MIQLNYLLYLRIEQGFHSADFFCCADERIGHQHRKVHYQANHTALGEKIYPDQCCNYTEYSMLPNTKMQGCATSFILYLISLFQAVFRIDDLMSPREIFVHVMSSIMKTANISA